MCSRGFVTSSPLFKLLHIATQFRLYLHVLDMLGVSSHLTLLPYGIVVRHLRVLLYLARDCLLESSPDLANLRCNVATTLGNKFTLILFSCCIILVVGEANLSSTREYYLLVFQFYLNIWIVLSIQGHRLPE